MHRLLRLFSLECVLALVIAMASVQFVVHTTQPSFSDPELVSYLAAGGSLDDLCLSGAPGENHSDCPLCREVESVAFLPPASTLLRVHFVTTRIDVHDPQPSRHAWVTLKKPARAPPLA